MLIERVLFNVIAFLLFLLMFYKMVKKNDTNYIIMIIVQALGIAISFLELLAGVMNWTFVKFLSYLMSVALPLIYFYLEKQNINMIEKAYILRVKLYLLTKNNAKAKNKLVYIVTKYPDSYVGHKMLAEIYEKEGGMRKSIDEYVKAIDIKKTDYDSYYKIAELLNSLSKKDESISMLENLLKNKPDYIKASNLLGDLLIESERYKEAANVYLDALKYKNDDYDLYYNLGIAYTHLNDFKNAKLVYEKAAEINHLQCRASYSLGKIALIYNDVESAEHYFTEAIYGEEVEAMAYYELAKIYMLKKDKEKAIIFLNKAIELEEIYSKKIDEETIFAPIMAYIERNPVRSKNIAKTLSEKELKVKEHLDKTFNVVEKLNISEKYERTDYRKEKDNDRRDW